MATTCPPLVFIFDYGGVISESPFPPLKAYSDSLVRTARQRAGGHLHRLHEPVPPFLKHLAAFSAVVWAPGPLHLLEVGAISRREFVSRFRIAATEFLDFIEGTRSPMPTENVAEFQRVSQEIRKQYDPTIFTPMVCWILRGLMDGEAYLSILERCPLRQDVLRFIRHVRHVLPTKAPGLEIRVGILTNNWESEYVRSVTLAGRTAEVDALNELLGALAEGEPANTTRTRGASARLFDVVAESVVLRKRKPEPDAYHDTVNLLLGTFAELNGKSRTSHAKSVRVSFLDDLPHNVEAALSSGAVTNAARIQSSADVVKFVCDQLRSAGISEGLIAEAEAVALKYKGELVELPCSSDLALVGGADIPAPQRFRPDEMKRLISCLHERLPSRFVPVEGKRTFGFDRVEVEYFKGGMSNPTFRLTTRTGTYVLRKQPKGKLLKGAHDVLREYKLFTFLRQAAAPVPVPVTLSYVGDASVLGTPFYVMRYVVGHIIRDVKEFFTIPASRTIEQHEALLSAFFSAALDSLIALHKAGVPPEMAKGVSLAVKSAKDSPVVKTVLVWERQYLDGNRRLLEQGKPSFVSEEFEQLTAALKGVLPSLPLPPKLALCHGDYKFDNMMFDRRPDTRAVQDDRKPELLALLDFELAAVGDPLTDVAYFTLMNYFPPPRGLLGVPKRDRALMWSPTKTLEYYCRATGALSSLSVADRASTFAIYQAACCQKLAGIVHGVVCRAMAGNASDVAGGLKLRSMFDGIVGIGHQLLAHRPAAKL